MGFHPYNDRTPCDPRLYTGAVALLLLIIVAIVYAFVSRSPAAATAAPIAYGRQAARTSARIRLRLYHSLSCGYCRMLMPEWLKFKARFSSDMRVSLEEIQCPDPQCSSAIVGGAPLKGYPTISVSVGGQPEQMFQVGPTTAQALADKLDGFLNK